MKRKPKMDEQIHIRVTESEKRLFKENIPDLSQRVRWFLHQIVKSINEE